MADAELIKELHEGNERLQRILEIIRIRQAGNRGKIDARRYAELRWLEKDYEDERNGDWTR